MQRATNNLLFPGVLVTALLAGCAPVNIVLQDVTGLDARGASVGDVNANTAVNASAQVEANATVNAPATGTTAAGPAAAPTTAPKPTATPRAYTGTVTTLSTFRSNLADVKGLNVDATGNFYFLGGAKGVLYRRSPDGTTTEIATLNSPSLSDMVIDSQGNFFVADEGQRVIHRVTPAGEVSTLLGGYTAAVWGGTGAEANVGTPLSLAIDANDRLLLGNASCLYAVTAAGEATLVVGNPSEDLTYSAGYQDGWERAQFNGPRDLAIDGQGIVYVADTKNHIIRRVDRVNKVVSGLAGGLKGVVPGFMDGLGVKAQFSTPQGLVVDKAGYIYVSDTENHRIRQISPEGRVTTLAGGTIGNQDGVGAAAQFNSPSQIAIAADGTLYVCDMGNRRLCKIE